MFDDRADAGRQLAVRLQGRVEADAVVLGLPRGGVPVAAEVAASLPAPLDVLVVRKLGHPQRPELGLGALAEDGVRWLDPTLVERFAVDPATLAEVEAREAAVLRRRVAELRRLRPAVPLAGREAVVVDDGLATGATARVACLLARRRGAARVVLAAPVAPRGIAARLPEADAVVAVAEPRHFAAVSQHYRDFRPTSEDEVRRLLTVAAG